MEKRCEAVIKSGDRCKKGLTGDRIYCKTHQYLSYSERRFGPNNKQKTFCNVIAEAYKLSNSSFGLKDENKLSELITEIKEFLQDDDIEVNCYPNSFMNDRIKMPVTGILYQSITIGDPEIIRSLIDKGVDVKMFNDKYLKQGVKLLSSQDDEDNYQINKMLLDQIKRMSERKIKRYIHDIVISDNARFLEYATDKFGMIDYAFELALSNKCVNSLRYLISKTEIKVTPTFHESVGIAQIFFEHFPSGMEQYIVTLPENLDDSVTEQVEFYKKLCDRYRNLENFQNLIDKGFYLAADRFKLVLMKYLLELGADPSFCYSPLFREINVDSLYETVNMCYYYTTPKIIDRLTLITQYYKLTPKSCEQISKLVNDLIDGFLDSHNVREIIKILIKFGIPSLPIISKN